MLIEPSSPLIGTPSFLQRHYFIEHLDLDSKTQYQNHSFNNYNSIKTLTDQHHARQTHSQRSRVLCNGTRPHQNGSPSSFRSPRYFATPGFGRRFPLQIVRDQRLQGLGKHEDAGRPATNYLVQRDGRPQRWILSALAHQRHGADCQLQVQGHLLDHGRMSGSKWRHYDLSVQGSRGGSKWQLCLLLGESSSPQALLFL